MLKGKSNDQGPEIFGGVQIVINGAYNRIVDRLDSNFAFGFLHYSDSLGNHAGLKEAEEFLRAGKLLIVFTGGVRRPKMSPEELATWEALKVSDRAVVLTPMCGEERLCWAIDKLQAAQQLPIKAPLG